MISPIALAGAILSAFIAGGINAISGGGTLITFPVLLHTGMASVTANATSTIALWPGIIGSLWGYRAELRESRRWTLIIVCPSLLGGILGALLLVGTRPQLFDHIAPFLVLCATLLFMSHSAISRLLKQKAAETDDPPVRRSRIAVYLVFQLLVAVYGGYFGAGMGILMLAAFGIMGLGNIHRMNAMKAWAAFCINGVAVAIFTSKGIVDWRVGLPMALGSIIGGYVGARLARRVPQRSVRNIIIAIGFIATLSLLLRLF